MHDRELHRFFRGLTIRAHVVLCEMWLLIWITSYRFPEYEGHDRADDCQMTRGVMLWKYLLSCLSHSCPEIQGPLKSLNPCQKSAVELQLAALGRVPQVLRTNISRDTPKTQALDGLKYQYSSPAPHPLPLICIHTRSPCGERKERKEATLISY